MGFDIAAPGDNLILDLKTTNKTPATFNYSANDLGYLIQAAWYIRGVKAALGKDVDFQFLAVEKEPPYCPFIQEIDADSIDTVNDAISEAAITYRDCVKSGIWHGYKNYDKVVYLDYNNTQRIGNYIEECGLARYLDLEGE
jgi:hypothetical protein